MYLAARKKMKKDEHWPGETTDNFQPSVWPYCGQLLSFPLSLRFASHSPFQENPLELCVPGERRSYLPQGRALQVEGVCPLAAVMRLGSSTQRVQECAAPTPLLFLDLKLLVDRVGKEQRRSTSLACMKSSSMASTSCAGAKNVLEFIISLYTCSMCVPASQFRLPSISSCHRVPLQFTYALDRKPAACNINAWPVVEWLWFPANFPAMLSQQSHYSS